MTPSMTTATAGVREATTAQAASVAATTAARTIIIQVAATTEPLTSVAIPFTTTILVASAALITTTVDDATTTKRMIIAATVVAPTMETVIAIRRSQDATTNSQTSVPQGLTSQTSEMDATSPGVAGPTIAFLETRPSMCLTAPALSVGSLPRSTAAVSPVGLAVGQTFASPRLPSVVAPPR